MIEVHDLADSSVIIKSDAELNVKTMQKIKELLNYVYEVRDNSFISMQATKIANDIEDEEETNEDEDEE